MTDSLLNDKNKNLFNAFLQLKNVNEMAFFCRDLMTEGEIEEFANRWIIAQELSNGKTQRQVAAKTGVSITTVTRVNKWLRRGCNGYQTVVDRLNNDLEN